MPHFDANNITQFITFRLADSVPKKVVEQMKEDFKGLPEQKRTIAEQSRINKFLDLGHGACHLRKPIFAELVESALHHFDGERYRLLSWVIMPNHVHTLVEIGESHSLDSIIHSWKSFTAKKANEHLNTSGPFWFREYFDRFIRDESHFWNVVRYIEMNPVKAKFCTDPCDWLHSSARLRLSDDLQPRCASGTLAVPGE